MENQKKVTMEKVSEKIGSIIGYVLGWFLSALLIWWGWNTLAYHLNLFTLGYWEVFAIRMAFSSILTMVALSFKKK